MFKQSSFVSSIIKKILKILWNSDIRTSDYECFSLSSYFHTLGFLLTSLNICHKQHILFGIHTLRESAVASEVSVP